jgi:hypothetical protein
MNPPFLASAMGEIQAASNYGCILRKGYYFRIHLPALSSPDAEAVAGVYESPLGGIGANAVDPSFGELFWGAYAWPAEAGAWPQSTFFISQEGDVAKLGAAGSTRYFGLNGGPTFDAAYSSETPGDMRGATAFAAMGRAANDGGVWTQAGN